jgi:ATP-dependent DNA helicase DinG
MAKKPPIRIALDLETTGLYAEQDAILEVAAIKFQGENIIDTFESFVAPGRSIPFRVQRLTGITSELLTGAPHFEAIARKLQAFLGDFPIVGHSIPFDVGFLRRRGLARTNPLIDTFELATVLLPSLSSYSLGQVAEALGIQVPDGRHRAMVDTMLAMNVFLALHHRLQSVDVALLKDLANLDAPRSWPLLHFFRQELRERQERDGLYGPLLRGSLGDRFAAQLGMDPRVLSFAVANQPQQLLYASTTPLETLQQMQETVEVIPEQVGQEKLEKPAEPHSYQMAHAAVQKALEQWSPLLMEVTIGGSDYAPVLLPALEWVLAAAEEPEAHAQRLVIACATQQHARRLIEMVLPRLQATLKSSLPVAYLAERGGYLCIHRWFGAALRRTSGELTAEQARGLAKLALWAQQTQTGERRELTLLPQEIAAWERICSGVERITSADPRSGTTYDRCTYRRKGYCFVSLAEERVQAARIVVTTHAGLFDDLSSTHSLLAPIAHRLILDADLLEDENARWNSNELDCVHLLRLLDTLGAELPDGRYQGLLALAAPSLRENGPGGFSTMPTVAKTELDAHMLTWFQTLRQARSAVESLFLSFDRLLEEFAQQGAGSSGREKARNDTAGRVHSGHGTRSNERIDQPLRLSGQIRALAAWADTERTWQQAAQRLQAAIDLAHEAEKIILTTQRSRHRLDIGSGEESSVASELAAVAQQLQEQKQLGQLALSLIEGDTVYWLRMPPPLPTTAQQAGQQRLAEAATSSTRAPETLPILYTQLVQTSSQLKRFLLADSASTIFAGTSLAVDASFAFCRNRFGLDHEACPALSVVTEHHEQTLLYIPNDVPEPNTPQYQRYLDDALVQLAATLDGQLVALFTSHAALRSSYGAIKPLLEMHNILVLAQGIDGSPRQLWQIFQGQERVVVLGTGSFWEGMDEMVQTPSCLFIARLPMPVLNDPPMAARAEQYSDQLHQFTVPVASLRMRRTLNKLVWSDTKRNAVVLFDRRVISKAYGPMILNSLPRCSQRQAAVSHLPEIVLDWLTGTGAWE